jgi:hypothetical protein
VARLRGRGSDAFPPYVFGRIVTRGAFEQAFKIIEGATEMQLIMLAQILKLVSGPAGK